MEKLFKNFDELLEFDFSKLEPQKSNYLWINLSNGLPKIKKKEDWSVRRRSEDLIPKIVFEITPRWLTITIHRGEGKTTIEGNFELKKGMDPKKLIQEILEF